MLKLNKISVIGLGYIGLPTAALFAAQKHKVIGVDVNPKVVETINLGQIHIVEPHLDKIVSTVVQEGYLRATTKVEPADVFIIAVPTPFGEGHKPKLDFIKSAAEAIAPELKEGDLIILESTSPVGATEQMSSWLAKDRPDLKFPHENGSDADINIAHCPERVLPGNIVHELVNNSRIIGGLSTACAERARDFYKILVKGNCILTDAKTAEMVKLTENAFRDVNIAFANELSLICDDLDIDVFELIELASLHPRVNILRPGPGVGGHCIAIDPWFIVTKSPEKARLIKCARDVNDNKPFWVIDKIKSAVSDLLNETPDKTMSDITVAILGISYKADIDDLRESPSLMIAETVASKLNCNTMIVEPNIEELPASLKGKAELASLDHALDKADCIALLVEHKQFREFDTANLPDKVIIDTKGLWH